MKGDDIAARFEAFAASVVALVRRLPKDRAGNLMGDELLRSATGGGSNYEAAELVAILMSSAKTAKAGGR